MRMAMKDVFTRDEIRQWKVKRQGNNRYRYTLETGETVYQLHRTRIVIFTDAGIRLNTNGWLTHTTVKAMNEVLLDNSFYSVRRREGALKVSARITNKFFVEFPVEDGVVLPVDRHIIIDRIEKGEFGGKARMEWLLHK